MAAKRKTKTKSKSRVNEAGNYTKPALRKYATPADARATVAKVKRINKPYARKIQILTVLEQRSKFANKPQQASIAKKAKEVLKKNRPKKRSK
jgi:hypothetical protein